MSTLRIDPSLPVVVVGAGPVGATAAWAAARAGLTVVLLEREPVTRTDWRASTFHPPTLELLDELGLAEEMHAQGLRVPRYQFRDRQQGRIAEFDFGVLADETRFPHRLQLNQQHLVRMAMERLEEEPRVDVRYGTSLVGIAQDAGGDGAEVEVEGPAGRETIRAGFVIGADGASSTLRRLLGVSFDGFTYPARFLIASTTADFHQLLPDIADVNYIADPEEWLFLLRTPESWRAVYPVPEDGSAVDPLELDEVQQHLQGIAPLGSGYVISDAQIYSVHQRVAGTFRVGACALIGDAAHINSPLGGVGLNSGIHDAVDLTRRLIRVLRDGADAEAELDAFDRVRRQVAVDYVQADTQRNTERMSERDPERRAEHFAELRAIATNAERHRAWCRRASLLESVARFGIGVTPDAADPELDEAVSATV
jgi:2-polyprenyl-6-methoxyphenol hydroxylase-like FAD-dependent oxidoreductase